MSRPPRDPLMLWFWLWVMNVAHGRRWRGLYLWALERACRVAYRDTWGQAPPDGPAPWDEVRP